MSDAELLTVAGEELLGDDMTTSEKVKLGVGAGGELISKIVDAANKSKNAPAPVAIVPAGPPPAASNFLQEYRTPLIVGGVAVGGLALVMVVLKMMKGRK